MIAMLNGTVAEYINELVVLDVNGVGYGLLVSQEDWGKLSKGSQATLYVYEHVREQAYDLYGFSSLASKNLFELLLSVNGVGPKMALSILSVGSSDELRQAIAEGNVKFLQAASGVGKKVAERVVVDLKDKVGLGNNSGATTFLTTPAVNRFDEAQEALLALGYSAQDAVSALSGVDATLPTEERIRLALKAKQ